MINLKENPASIEKLIPIEKIFDEETIKQFEITEATWLMTIKPGIRNVSCYIDGRIRMEEIEVISLKIETTSDKCSYQNLLSQLHEKIMYPCVVLILYHDKYKIAAWKFVDGGRKSNGVVLKAPYISAWIREPATSKKTELCTQMVSDLLLNGAGDLKTLYDQICNAILNCPPQYIGSHTHLSRLLYDLTGKESHPIKNKIDTIKRYEVKNSPFKYQKKEFGASYKYSFEYEDVWAAFMEDEQIRKIIEKRKYCDIEELVMRIDMKYEEMDSRR